MAIPDEALLNILSSSSKKSFTFLKGKDRPGFISFGLLDVL
jgi:hypothetical protein